MKASELIKHLEVVIKENGDLDIQIASISGENEQADLRGISIVMDQNDKPRQFLLCDEETFLAFCE